jgi:DNA primase large subunit
VRRDAISHYVLRVAFCRTEENRRWFVSQERALLKLRLNKLDTGDLVLFMRANGLTYTTLTESDFKRLHTDIETVEAAQRYAGTITHTTARSHFRVPFEEALELVRERGVVLDSGDAIVECKYLTTVVLGRYRASLSEAMAATSRAYPVIAPNLSRLAPVFEFASRRITMPTEDSRFAFSGSQRTTTVADIETLYDKSFPPCMRRLHKALVKDNHLRHGGRMQYSLFLKGLGLPMEELLRFWSSKFAVYAQSEAKLRPYLYGIRHMYGKEGKGVDYTPFGCLKIITSSVPPNEPHGCPFNPAHLQPEVLCAEVLEAAGLSQVDAHEVAEIAAAGHYQIACGRFFVLRHPGVPDTEIAVNHPNGFAAQSRRYWAAKLAPTTPVPAPASVPAPTPAPPTIGDDGDDGGDVEMM